MLISDTVLDYTQENDTLEDWISNIKSSSDHALKNALFELDNISGNWFQPAADYIPVRFSLIRKSGVISH